VLNEGQILEGKYRLGRLLGRGGMGSVFLGEHTRIKRAVAIKILHEEKADSENTQRFEREAEAAGRIGSDHIVEVLDFGSTPDGDRFMVMEYLDGETLKQRLKRVGRLEPVELAAIATQVAEGLGAAHAAGIVHRDLKPDNLFIVKSKAGRTDFMKIVDFGISKFNSLTGEAGGMTKTGAVMGTPYYMSPEQARATNEVDERSDVYSLGVVLYEAVTGAVPFNGNTLTELMFKIVFEEPPHPLAVVPALDQEFAGLVLKAMSRDPARRFQSAAELKAALASWSERHPNGAARGGVGQQQPQLGGTAILDAPQGIGNAFARSSPAVPVPPSMRRPSAPTQPMPQGGLAAPSQVGGLPFQQSSSSLSAMQSSPNLAVPGFSTNGAVLGYAPTAEARPPSASMMGGGGTFDAMVATAPPKRGKAGVVVALSALVLVVGAAAVWFAATRGASRSSASPAPSTPAEATAAPARATAAPAASATAAAPAPAPAATSATPEPGPAPEPRASSVAAEPPRANGHPGAPTRGGQRGHGAPVAEPPKPADAPVAAPPRPNPAGTGTVKDFGY
jgi:serine/threonine-protein kinase